MIFPVCLFPIRRELSGVQCFLKMGKFYGDVLPILFSCVGDVLTNSGAFD